MTTLAPTCPHCLDTGSLSKRLDASYLDCGHCPAGEKRAEFNKWARVFIHASVDAAMWAAYQRGRHDGIAEARDGQPQ